MINRLQFLKWPLEADFRIESIRLFSIVKMHKFTAVKNLVQKWLLWINVLQKRRDNATVRTLVMLMVRGAHALIIYGMLRQETVAVACLLGLTSAYSSH